MDYSRDAPPSGPPPAYHTVIRKVYPYSVRWILFTTCVISEVYLFWSGGTEIAGSGRFGYTGSLHVLSIVGAILFFVAGGIEVWGSLGAALERLFIAKSYAALTPIGLALTAAGQLVGIVAHFSHKDEIINACTKYNTGRTDVAYSSSWLLWPSISDQTNEPLTEAQARNICTKNWDNGKAGSILGLIVTLIIGFIFMSLAFVYVRELVDPNSLRRRQRVVVDQVPLSTYAGGYPAAPGYYANPHAPSGPYAPPPGPPPTGLEEGYGYAAAGAGGQPYPGYGMPPKYERGMASSDFAHDADAKELDGPYGYGAFRGGRDADGQRERDEEEQRGSSSRPGSSRGVPTSGTTVRRVGDEDEEEEEDQSSPLRNSSRVPDEPPRL